MTEPRDALHDLPSRLAERMQAARTEDRHRAWLAVESAGVGFLLPLAQAGEIFPLGDILPVAHVRPWFCGVTNLRGALHGVVDLASFLGLRERAPVEAAPQPRDGARLLALNPELRAQCALRVDHLAGLRRWSEHWRELPAPALRPAFAGSVWMDPQGRSWQELDLSELVNQDAFLAIAAPLVG